MFEADSSSAARPALASLRLIVALCLILSPCLAYTQETPTTQQTPPTKDASQEMQFSDLPHFSVAGVTDWTAAGGHGSDSTLRTSESIAAATANLRSGNVLPETLSSDDKAHESELHAAVTRSPKSFAANEQLGTFYLDHRRFSEALPFLETAYGIDAANPDNLVAIATAYKATGDLARARTIVTTSLAVNKMANMYRIAGELDEELNQPLAAVQEFERAATLEATEQNEFEWASELLRHRAIWQAEAVFRKGVAAYPQSLRMNAGLGAALFASARYDDAALQLCKASDLDPKDPGAYLLLGKIQLAAPRPLACVEPKLKQFLAMSPDSSEANFLYAMTLLKTPESPDVSSHVASLLNKAVSLDPKCGEAYLELGVLAFAREDTLAAISFYTSAIAADPDLADAHYRLGIAYERSGDSIHAKEEFVLHDEIKQREAIAIEVQRKAVKQFLFTDTIEPANAHLE